MALALSLLTEGSDTTNNPSTTAAINPASGSVSYAWVAYAVVSGTTSGAHSVSLTGGRGAWETIADISNADVGTGRRGMFLVKGTGSVANEAVSITVSPSGGETWTETAWCFVEATGQDATPNDAPVEAGGVATSGGLPDVGTPGSGDRVIGGWLHETAEDVTASGLTQLGNGIENGSDIRTLHVFYDASDPQDETPAASWATNSTWGAIGMIVNAAAGGGVPETMPYDPQRPGTPKRVKNLLALRQNIAADQSGPITGPQPEAVASPIFKLRHKPIWWGG